MTTTIIRTFLITLACSAAMTSLAPAADLSPPPTAPLPSLEWYVRADAAYRFNRISGGDAFGNPFAAMQTSPRIQLKRLMVDAPSLIVACGLAMRRFDPV